MCRVLGVSTSGFYAWLKRGPSRRTREDKVLADRIRWLHLRSRGTYGVPRIYEDLLEEGIRIGRKRIARLMKAMRIQGVSRRKRASTTVRQAGAKPAPDLVERDFTADGPNKLWVADITYISTWGRFSIPGRCGGRMEPTGCRMADGQSYANPIGPRCAGHGY